MEKKYTIIKPFSKTILVKTEYGHDFVFWPQGDIYNFGHEIVYFANQEDAEKFLGENKYSPTSILGIYI